MIDNLMKLLSVVIWGSIGFSLGFAIIRLSALAYNNRKDKDYSEPFLIKPDAAVKPKPRKPRNKKQS